MSNPRAPEEQNRPRTTDLQRAEGTQKLPSNEPPDSPKEVRTGETTKKETIKQNRDYKRTILRMPLWGRSASFFHDYSYTPSHHRIKTVQKVTAMGASVDYQWVRTSSFMNTSSRNEVRILLALCLPGDPLVSTLDQSILKDRKLWTSLCLKI